MTDEHENPHAGQGGSYRLEGGKMVLQHRTDHVPEPVAEQPAVPVADAPQVSVPAAGKIKSKKADSALGETAPGGEQQTDQLTPGDK